MSEYVANISYTHKRFKIDETISTITLHCLLDHVRLPISGTLVACTIFKMFAN